jgi:hypothetical protein
LEKSKNSPTKGAPEVLHQFGQKLSQAKALRRGHVVLRLSGSEGGNFCFSFDGKSFVSSAEIPPGPHAVELIGDGKRIRSVLSGAKDARAQFLAGGFRLRGDMKYISDLAVELGLLTQPI